MLYYHFAMQYVNADILIALAPQHIGYLGLLLGSLSAILHTSPSCFVDIFKASELRTQGYELQI